MSTRPSTAPTHCTLKAPVVEAVCVPVSNDYPDGAAWWAGMRAVADWCEGRPHFSGTESNGIQLDDGQWAFEGDWVIRLAGGAFQVASPQRFAAVYELAEVQAS
jgi:hypothetical protein